MKPEDVLVQCSGDLTRNTAGTALFYSRRKLFRSFLHEDLGTGGVSSQTSRASRSKTDGIACIQ